MKLILKRTLFFVCLMAGVAQAEVQVVDDVGQKIVLQQTAKRIVSLAPHITELLFNAGATNQLVGTVSFSDYPQQAKSIQRIGSYNEFDLERIVALQPDLIIAWESGNTMTRIDQVRALGFPVFINEPRTFSDIEKSLRKLGALLGTEPAAKKAAEDFNVAIQQLMTKNKQKAAVSVFYQVWNEPLFTVNGKHLISKVIEACGGVNVFKGVPSLSPQISVEAVIQRNPDVIVAGMNKGRTHWLDEWKKWRGIKAVKDGHLYPIDADLIVRHTPRILLGTEKMCEILEQVRDQNK